MARNQEQHRQEEKGQKSKYNDIYNLSDEIAMTKGGNGIRDENIFNLEIISHISRI